MSIVRLAESAPLSLPDCAAPCSRRAAGRCILGDDMGLGKTVQTHGRRRDPGPRARHRARAGGGAGVGEVPVGDGDTQVHAPRSADHRRHRRAAPGAVQPADVLSPHQLRTSRPRSRRVERLAAGPDRLDEAQRIKNWESKTSRAVKKLRSRYAIVLTGTPLENKLEELYSIVAFVDDRRLGPAFQFLSDHRVLDADGKLLGYRNLDSIASGSNRSCCVGRGAKS